MILIVMNNNEVKSLGPKIGGLKSYPVPILCGVNCGYLLHSLSQIMKSNWFGRLSQTMCISKGESASVLSGIGKKVHRALLHSFLKCL